MLIIISDHVSVGSQEGQKIRCCLRRLEDGEDFCFLSFLLQKGSPVGSTNVPSQRAKVRVPGECALRLPSRLFPD